MKIEVYIPDYEKEVIAKALDLKKRRKLSGYIVEIMKKEDNSLTKEEIIKLIEQHTRTASNNTMSDSIKSILGGF